MRKHTFFCIRITLTNILDNLDAPPDKISNKSPYDKAISVETSL